MSAHAPAIASTEVGHDFNNLLTVILGNVELMVGMLDAPARSDAEFREALDQIERAARRAVALAREIEGAAADENGAGPIEGSNRGTILVCEDEEMVRVIATKVLEASGYAVLAARDAREAMDLARAHDGPIDLLVTDVVMPGMNGRALAESLGAARPGTSVLFVSGYPAGDVGARVALAPGAELLEKPFGPAALLRRVQQLMAKRSR